MSKIINADKYMNCLRAEISVEADIIAKDIKKDVPIGTVKDCGRIGRLQGLQWARNALETDYYTVSAIVIPKGATNGDVIQTMFPDADVIEFMGTITVDIPKHGAKCRQKIRFDLDFWNAPFKRSEEE